MKTLLRSKKTLLTFVLVLFVGSISLSGSAARAATGAWTDVSATSNGYGTTPPTHTYGTYGPIPKRATSNTNEQYPASPYDGTPVSPTDCLNQTPMIVTNNVAYLLRPADLHNSWGLNKGPLSDVTSGYCPFVYGSPATDSNDRIWKLDLAVGTRLGWNMGLKKVYAQTGLTTAQKDIHYGSGNTYNTKLSGALTTLATNPATGNPSIYFFGGSGYLTSLGDDQRAVYVYDLVSDSWSVKSATLPYRMAFGSATVVGGDVYLIGGWKNVGVVGTVANSDVYSYNLATNTFTKRGAINAPASTATAGAVTAAGVMGARNYRVKHRGIAIGTKIYLFGGMYGDLGIKRVLYDECTTPVSVGFSTVCAENASMVAANAVEANRGWVWEYDTASQTFTSYSRYPGDPGINVSAPDDAGISSAALSADGTTVYSLVDSAAIFVPVLIGGGKAMNTPAASIASTLFTLNLSTGTWTAEPMDTKRIIFHSPFAAATSDGYVAMGHTICESNTCMGNVDTTGTIRPNGGNFWIKFFKPTPPAVPKLVVEPDSVSMLIGATGQYRAYYYPDETQATRSEVTSGASWSSNDDHIATMDPSVTTGGAFKGMAEGATPIMASYLNAQGQTVTDTATAVVNIVNPTDEGIRLSPTSLTLVRGTGAASIGRVSAIYSDGSTQRVLNAKEMTSVATNKYWSESLNPANITSRLLGDVNNSGTILSSDAISAQNKIAAGSLSELDKAVIDVNQDGSADSRDVTLILQAASSANNYPGAYIIQGDVSTTATPDAKVRATYQGTTLLTAEANVEVVDSPANLPDLTVSLVTPASPTVVTLNTLTTFSATIYNSLIAPTPTGFTNRFASSTDSEGSGETDFVTVRQATPLIAGQSAPSTFSYTFTTPGTYYWRACADQNNKNDTNGEVSESIENNNCGSSWSQIAVSGYPTVTTPTASAVTQTGATFTANVTSTGGSAILARGFCWGATASPTSCTNAAPGSGTGSFSLTPTTPWAQGTKVYYRAFARNAAGIAYSPADGWLWNGVCGTANGRTYPYEATSYSPYPQCANPPAPGGVPSTTAIPPVGSSRNWTCTGNGSNAGGFISSPTCTASRDAAPVVVLVPTVNIDASPKRVPKCGNTTVRWTTENSPTSCLLTRLPATTTWPVNPQTVLGVSGTTLVDAVCENTMYTITCSNTGGTSPADSVIVNILPDFTEF